MKVGIIGYGNMASAMLNGLLAHGTLSPSDVIVSSRTLSRMAPLVERWPEVEITTDNGLAARTSDLLFICVRSEQVPAVMNEVRPSLSPSGHLVLINGGVSISDIDSAAPVSKVIPSITAEVGRGVTLVHHRDDVGPEERGRLEDLFSSIGQVRVVDEGRLDAGTCLTSCGPAFIATIIEHFARSAEGRGYTYDEALVMLTETVLATASMMGTGRSPSSICGAVATEGGITEKGLEVMRRDLPALFDEVMDVVLGEHVRTGRALRGDR